MSIKQYPGGIITKNPTQPSGSYQCSSASGMWTLNQAANYVKQGIWPTAGNTPPRCSASYTTAGSYTWVAPAGVTSVSVVAVGPGGRSASYGSFPSSPGIGGGGGGALAYQNNITVVPGNSYSVVVGTPTTSTYTNVPTCARSNFNCVVIAGGGYQARTNAAGGLYGGAGGCVFGGTGGSNGGAGGQGHPAPLNSSFYFGGGGGASGYTGYGGAGASYNQSVGGAPFSGSGGGGGGGAGCGNAGTGGGVGILGKGADGVGGTSKYCATCGSGWGTPGSGGAGSGSTKLYGGGASGGCGNGSVGAVRIIWPGSTRSFPSTCAGSP